MHTGGTADAFAVGVREPVGQYTYYVREDRWVWSEEMYRLHGFEPGEIVPTTALVFSHKRPGERAVPRDDLAEAVASGAPFGFSHRIVDAAGRVRTVVAVGAGVKDESGELVEVRGYLVDVSDGLRRYASEAVSAAFEHRGVIDEAKGMLMLVNRIDADAAFGLLRKASQETNTKLYVIATAVVEALAGDAHSRSAEELRQVVDEVLYDGRAGPSPEEGPT